MNKPTNSLSLIGLLLLLLLLLVDGKIVYILTYVRGLQMNFAIVIFSGVMLLSAVNYFVSAHRKYTGPVATCEGRQDG